MSDEAILSIDQGTTNSKAILIGSDGQIIAQGSSPLNISYPKPGWVEQSAEEIWSSVIEAVRKCLEQSPGTKVVGIGLSNQRESVVAWDTQSGQSLAPAITWQCRRTASATECLKSEGHEPTVLALTGLPLDPLFPASKIRWLMDNTQGTNRCIGTVDSWLIWKLTGGQHYATDRSNASRTQLLNVQSGQWDESLCTLFGVDIKLLPEVRNSQHTFGHTRDVPGLGDGIPVASAIGDSHAALFGHAAFHPGEAKVTFGTGSSVMMVTSAFQMPADGMTCTIAWSVDDEITYALEGNILVSAALFPWAATLLGLDGDVDKLMRLAQSVEHSDGVTLVPALVGLGAPHWNPEARGILAGLSFSSTPAHIAHAAAASMSLQVVDVFTAMHRQSASPPRQVNVDGGPTRNKFLMQSLANLLSLPVSISEDPELSALGAGMLAGLEIGFWRSRDEVARLHRERVTIHPDMDEQSRANILSVWNEAIVKCQYSSGS
ncbi:MAG: FGGY family carbohydrate kinase [Granulosicoccus sp.]